MIIDHIHDLKALRRERDRELVEIDLGAFLQGNLPLYAVRFGLWALKPEGRLVLRAANTLDTVCCTLSRWPFQLLVQLVCKALDGLGELVGSDVAERRIECRRTAPVLQPAPWSAAVVFSGQDAERPLLQTCLQGLLAQPEIAEGGQVLVCGPAAARAAVADQPGVEYLPMETPSRAGRFLVGVKKNAAIRALRHERLLVCHTRIVLRPHCLAALPREFDTITPRVWVQGARAALPYLDLGFFSTDSVALVSSRSQPRIHYDRETWLERAGQQYAYIDGGLFCVRRSLALAHPLSEVVAWGEAEDAEWALRLVHQGQLVELCTEANADSTTCKTPRYARWGHSRWYRFLSIARTRAAALGRRWWPVVPARTRSSEERDP